MADTKLSDPVHLMKIVTGCNSAGDGPASNKIHWTAPV